MRTNTNLVPHNRVRTPGVRAARFGALLVVASLPASQVGAQEASFYQRLGKDTVSVEQFTRTGNRVVGDLASRQGVAVQRIQYEVVLGADGRATSIVYRQKTGAGAPVPNAPREITYTFSGDSVKRVAQFADSANTRMFPAARATPIQGTAVGLFEIAFQQMRKAKADSFAFFPISAAGVAGQPAWFKSLGGDSVRASNGLIFRVDATGKVLAVHGLATTQKIMATRNTSHVDFDALAGKMQPTGVLSQRGLAHGSFLQSVMFIDYGRPQVRERTVWGGLLVPPDTIWRAGANEATHFATSREVTFGDVVVPPGLYTLFFFNAKGGPQLVINKQVGQWGTVYDQSKDLARIPVVMGAAPEHTEEFTINIRATGQRAGAIDLVWGSQVASAAFTVK